MRRALLSLTSVILLGCSTLKSLDIPKPPAHAVFGAWGVDESFMDKSVKPGDDFFAYANGTWLKTTEIPADRSYSGASLEIEQSNEARLKGIMADLVKQPDRKLSGEQCKLRDLYAAFLDESGIEAKGLDPAKADLATIHAISTLEDVAAAMGDPALGLDGPFDAAIEADDKQPTAYVVWLGQSGLGLPDRDYYLRGDKAIKDTRAAYKKYLATMLSLAGEADAEKRAAAIFDLEVKLAHQHWPADETRDATKVYNKVTFTELEKLAPQFPWTAYFARAGIPLKTPKGERNFIAEEKSAFPKLARVFAATPVTVWRDYLETRYLHRFSDFLPKRIDDADFAFYGMVLSGKAKQLDRATRGVDLVDGTMGEALGKLYVAKYFPPAAKAKAQTLVANLIKAYDADIRQLDWMTGVTRQKALDKLHKTTIKVGYPDVWRDYAALAISRANLVGDVKNATVFEWNRKLKRIDDPVDRTEWDMSPPTVNAYHNDEFNEIVFPAGILQPPYFDPNADDAVNYAETGSTIGHEISHGFDDQGAKYDGDGALNNWWTKEDQAKFDKRNAMLVDQFAQYEPLKGIHVNGKLTLGENIADLAGLAIAYKAYRLSLGGKEAQVVDGYTGDQRFFLAYGQAWRTKWRDDTLRRILLSDPHAPDAYRANGTLRNLDSWYAAYDVKPGEKNYLSPEQRVRLW